MSVCDWIEQIKPHAVFGDRSTGISRWESYRKRKWLNNKAKVMNVWCMYVRENKNKYYKLEFGDRSTGIYAVFNKSTHGSQCLTVFL